MRTTITAGSRTLALALSLGLVAACATTQAPGRSVSLSDPTQIRALFDSLEAVRLERTLAEANRPDGPHVELWTDATYLSPNRVRASFRLDDDAYVAVFNVARDSRVTMVYPETPEDPSLLRGGHTYKLPEFFPGFSAHGSALNRTSYYTTGLGRSIDEGGYVFIVASWSPLRLDRLEELDLLDSFRNASFTSMQPYNVMHDYADVLVPRGKRWYTVKYKYYGEPGGSVFANRAYSQCSHGGFVGTGYDSYRAIASLLGHPNFSRFAIASMLSDIAMEGCEGRGLANAYLAALMAGFGNTNVGRPTFPTLPPPSIPGTGGGDTVATGTGSQPLPPEHEERDKGRTRKPQECLTGKCDEPVDRPRRGQVAESDDDGAIQLGGRRRGRAADEGDGTRAWSVRDRELPRVDGPRAYRGRDTRVDAPVVGRGAAPRVDEGGSASGPRTERPRAEPRPRPEARAEQPAPVERPRAEPVRQAPPVRETPASPPPRVERSEPPPRPVERTEPVKPADP